MRVVPAWSTSAAVKLRGLRLLGAFSRRLIVDCETKGAPLAGQRDRDLHQRIMPQPVKVDGILMAAGDR